MSIQLEKRAEAVRISLAKRHINQAPIMRVGLATDVSGSAQHLYRNGVIQETVDRLLGLSANFDDNGEMDMWAFDDKVIPLETAKASDYGSYVQRHILNQPGLWGSTNYAPPMQAMLDFFFKVQEKKSGGFFGFGAKKEAVAPVNANIPALALFITDGDNYDKDATRRVMIASQKHPIYWSLVGVGSAHHFGFLEEMADLLPNAGFTNLSSLSVSDEQLYDSIICDELCEWVKKPHV